MAGERRTPGPAGAVRRFAAFTNQYPWQWEPAEAFIAQLTVAVPTAAKTLTAGNLLSKPTKHTNRN